MKFLFLFFVFNYGAQKGGCQNEDTGGTINDLVIIPIQLKNWRRVNFFLNLWSVILQKKN